MVSKSKHYVLLENELQPAERQYQAGQAWRCNRVLLVGFLISFGLNLFLVTTRLRSSRDIAHFEESEYGTFPSESETSITAELYTAHLPRDSAVAWTAKSPYFGEEGIAADRLWEEFSIDNGTVALSDSYAQAMGLPLSQRFPWDQEKGLYLLNGFHSMHCLKTIRQAVLEFDRGLESSEPTEHILHCLDALRQDVLCYADDTPRYTGLQPSGRSGTGQLRQCRSWSQLEAWAQQHTACWRYTNPHDHEFDILERHKFCPDGSPYIAKVKETFGGL